MLLHEGAGAVGLTAFPLERGPLAAGTGVFGGWRATSYFGGRPNPFTGVPSWHGGMDLACPRGTKMFAALPGFVYQGWDSSGGGNWSSLKCDSGEYLGYGHALSFADGLVSGSRVEAGQLIGFVDSTGASTGHHLHFAYKRPFTLSYADPHDLLLECDAFTSSSPFPTNHPHIDVPAIAQLPPRTDEEILVDITYWRQPNSTISAVGLEPFLSPLAQGRDGIAPSSQHFVGGLFRYDFTDPDEFTLAAGPHAAAVELTDEGLLNKLNSLPLIFQAQ